MVKQGCEVKGLSKTLHLDQERFDSLRELLGIDETTSLVELYLGEAKTHLSTLYSLVEQGESESVRRMAHTLRGSSSTLGALHMQELCRELEGSASSVEICRSLVADMEKALQGLQEVIFGVLVE